VRVLWTYEHPTARFQEMMLFPAAGIEVVPTYTDIQTSWVDSRYHDESHPLYPRWRSTCSMPVNVVERVRRSRLWERDFQLEPPEAKLINDNFEGMFINCSPSTLEKIFSWYRGKVLFRCNGGPNRKALYEDAAQWVDVARRAGRIRDFIYLPGHMNLVVPEMLEAGVKIVHWPVFSDEARIPGEWARQTSRTIATAISYLDFHQHFQGQLKDILDAYGGSDLNVRVFGKNKVVRTAAENVEIVGGLPSDNDFWGQIFACGAFVDAGADPTHTVFPPLEAALKGMPVFFCRDNGHVHAIQDYLPHVTLDERMGVLANHHDIRDYLLKVGGDVDALTKLNHAQVAILRAYFSRENALAACRKIGDLLQTPMARLFSPPRALESQTPLEIAPLNKLLAGEKDRETVDFVRLNIRSGERLAGENVVRCAAVRGPAVEAQVLAEYLPALAPGAYELDIVFTAQPRDAQSPRHIGNLEVGRWAHGTEYQAESVPLSLDEAVVSVPFIVGEADRHWTREMRLSVFSSAEVRFRTIGLRRTSTAAASAA
jgi:hypothetical protein